MKSTANRKRVIGFAVTSALAGALLSGCATNAAPPATLSAAQAEQALASGKHRQAIEHAEAAVLAEPHNAAYRAVLGSAYLDAGRFASAETSFNDAVQLGDTSARTALSLSLALSAQGKYDESAALLNSRESEIATADLGLALALAAQPERGIHLMGNAIRGGENTAKMRQNLAFSYALAGRWREARLMAAQDVPANQINHRIEEWARMASPEAWHVRVAGLRQVPAGVSDAGQPVQLALANNPTIDQLAAEATPVAVADTIELAPLAMAAARSGAGSGRSDGRARSRPPSLPRRAHRWRRMPRGSRARRWSRRFRPGPPTRLPNARRRAPRRRRTAPTWSSSAASRASRAPSAPGVSTSGSTPSSPATTW